MNDRQADQPALTRVGLVAAIILLVALLWLSAAASDAQMWVLWQYTPAEWTMVSARMVNGTIRPHARRTFASVLFGTWKEAGTYATPAACQEQIDITFPPLRVGGRDLEHARQRLFISAHRVGAVCRHRSDQAPYWGRIK